MAPKKVNPASHPPTARISVNLGNERVFVKVEEIYYIEKTGRQTLIHCVNEKYKTRETLQELEQRLGTGFFRSHKSYIINVNRVERIVTFPGSSYYEAKFSDYKGRALISRDRVNELTGLLEQL